MHVHGGRATVPRRVPQPAAAARRARRLGRRPQNVRTAHPGQLLQVPPRKISESLFGSLHVHVGCDAAADQSLQGPRVNVSRSLFDSFSVHI